MRNSQKRPRATDDINNEAPFYRNRDKRQRCNYLDRSSDYLSSQTIGGLGLIGFALAWFTIDRLGHITPGQQSCVFLFFTGLPMVIASVFVNRTYLRTSSGLQQYAQPLNVPRCIIKLLGFGVTLVLLALLYWIFPEYKKPFYQPAWNALEILIPCSVPFVIIYFGWADSKMRNPKDGYYFSGLLVLGKWREVDLLLLGSHSLAWAVKGFFIPFMLAALGERSTHLAEKGWEYDNFISLYYTSTNLLYSIDVAFGALGYLLTIRGLDAQIRSTEPTWLGWISALSCYIPFSQFVQQSFISYKGKLSWAEWLIDHPFILVNWGMAILFLQFIYVWSTISFGVRFSNLTNRGIVTRGPYHYLKHPAYIAKNISWWLISIPFIAHGSIAENIRACLLLAVMNVIYYIRAKTEERHLLSDPAYKSYVRWIDQTSFLEKTLGTITLRRRRRQLVGAFS